LGDSAQCAGRSSRTRGIRVLTVLLPEPKFAGIALALIASAALGALNDVVPQGDAKAGAVIYERCLACHALAYDRAGPRHCGLFGRRAGSVKDFAYSDAMHRSKIVWNEKTLDRFLANPLKAVPGTAMGYAGVADPNERADLIAYLKQAGESTLCRH
jgi:cytochrome c